MKIFTFVLVLAVASQAQTPSPDKGEQTPPASATKVDPKLHADAIKLVEVTGTRKRILEGVDQSLDKGKQAMMERCPTCTPAFADEWQKRMKERFKVDDFIAVYVDEYEKYLTDSEILELITLQHESEAKQPAAPSEELKIKLTSVMTSLLSEIAGRCSQIGAKLGGDIGMEIQKEHPEYMQAAPKPDKP